MADQMAFVSAPAATPTINLSLNQPGLLKVKRDSFSLGAPQFEGDPRSGLGGYGERSVELTLQATGTYDDAATVFQDVSQQLVNGAPGMGGRNWLMFRWSAADPLMFLWTLPSSFEPLGFQNAGAGVWELPLSIVCDAALLGPPEDIASFVVTNSPVSGTNKMMVGPSILGTIKGDLETPLLLATTAMSQPGIPTDPTYLTSYALRGGFTHTLLARNLTELTSGTDTGATVTGAGANYIDGDYKSCSFATTTLSERLFGIFSTALTPMPGQYRVLIRAVVPTIAGTNSSDYTFAMSFATSSGQYTASVTKRMASSAVADSAYWVDLGVAQLHANSDYSGLGLTAAASTVEAPSVSIKAGASVVTGTVQPLRFDELILLPTSTTYGTAQMAIMSVSNSATSTRPIIADGFSDAMKYVYDASTTTPFAGIPTYRDSQVAWVGGLPTLVPGANNYLTTITRGLSTTANTTTYVGRYYPRYVQPRPSAT